MLTGEVQKRCSFESYSGVMFGYWGVMEQKTRFDSKNAGGFLRRRHQRHINSSMLPA
jgi:hypothetical protein